MNVSSFICVRPQLCSSVTLSNLPPLRLNLGKRGPPDGSRWRGQSVPSSEEGGGSLAPHPGAARAGRNFRTLAFAVPVLPRPVLGGCSVSRSTASHNLLVRDTVLQRKEAFSNRSEPENLGGQVSRTRVAGRATGVCLPGHVPAARASTGGVRVCVLRGPSEQPAAWAQPLL